MSFSVIVILLTAHWVADFVLQKEEWARGKHNSITDLLSHTVYYSMIMFFIVFVYQLITIKDLTTLRVEYILLFWFITLVTHTLVDFITSKFAHKLLDKQQYYTTVPNLGFFSVIGLDQLIHYIILFLTYKILFL